MNQHIEQTEDCSHDCDHHTDEHDHHHACSGDHIHDHACAAAAHDPHHNCAADHAVQVQIGGNQKSEHVPEGIVSKIVGFMDIAGVFASTLCTIHCLLLPIVLALLPVFAKELMHHDFVHVGLAGFVLVFCLMAYVPGYLNHGDKRLIWLGAVGLTLVFFATFVARDWGEAIEASIITAGNTVIIFGHLLNRKLLAHLKCKHH